MTVRDLLHHADSRELTEWAVYLKLEKDMKDEPKEIKPEEQIQVFKALTSGKRKKA